jgi:hypothetical protein
MNGNLAAGPGCGQSKSRNILQQRKPTTDAEGGGFS